MKRVGFFHFFEILWLESDPAMPEYYNLFSQVFVLETIFDGTFFQMQPGLPVGRKVFLLTEYDSPRGRHAVSLRSVVRRASHRIGMCVSRTALSCMGGCLRIQGHLAFPSFP